MYGDSLLKSMVKTRFKSERLICTTLASGYLFYYVATTHGGLVAGLAATFLVLWTAEEWRRNLYLRGRRSGHSLKGKLLS